MFCSLIYNNVIINIIYYIKGILLFYLFKIYSHSPQSSITKVRRKVIILEKYSNLKWWVSEADIILQCVSLIPVRWQTHAWIMTNAHHLLLSQHIDGQRTLWGKMGYIMIIITTIVLFAFCCIHSCVYNLHTSLWEILSQIYILF